MKNKVAIVYSDYYKEISELLVKGFNKSIDDRFICDAYKVDGSWELIHKINSLSDEYDKFVAIGIIVKGETDHYEYLSSSIANTLLSMTVTKNIYISNWLLLITFLLSISISHSFILIFLSRFISFCCKIDNSNRASSIC